MKQIFTCLVLLWALLSGSEVQAASPTVPASNISFFQPEGSRMSFSFTNGNGARRIIVVKAGSPIVGIPVNGVTYTGSQSFGNPSSLFTAPGEYVVVVGVSGSFTVTNLQPGTTYHIAIFEYNGTGTATEYLTLPGTASNATVSAPTTPAGAISFSAVAGSSAKIDFVKGNGARRLVVLRKNSAVDADPTDLVAYSESAHFGNGSAIGTGNYVVYGNIGSSVTVQNLEPDTDYHVSIYEYNGNGYPVYRKPATVSSFRTHTGPTTPASKLVFSNHDGNRHSMIITTGNGSKRLVIGRKGAAVSARPVNGSSYVGNAAFGSGTEIAPGEFVISNSNSTTLTITNLEPHSVYHYAVFEFDGTGSNTWYLTSSFLQGSTSTVTTPTTPASNIIFSGVTGSQATISCTRGDGAYRLFIIKEGSPVDAVPAEFADYPTSTQFGSATSAITPGNHALSNWTGNSVTVTNLKTATSYYVAVYEFNGPYNPIYLYSAATASFTTVTEPTVPVKAISYTAIEGNYSTISMSPGNGVRRMVIARKEAAVTARPTDGVHYTANKIFGTGSEIQPGEFVVHDGTGAVSFDITALEPNTNYHLAAFEYNLAPDGSPDYLINPFFASDFTTQKHPVIPASALTITAVQNTQVTVQLTAGNGASRLGILRDPAVAGIDPVDFRSYNASSYGSGHQTGPGNFAVMKTAGNSAVLSGLQPGTSYTLTVYELNGVSAPVYLLPGTSITFTTSGIPPLVIPTQPASNGVASNVEGNAAKLSFTRGNGSSRLIALRKGTAVSFIPAEGTGYTADARFGTGTAVRPGEYIVYNGNANNVDISGLEPESEYHAAIFEFNTDGTGYKYQSTGFYTTSFSTLLSPVTGSSDLQTTSTSNSIAIGFSKGSGTRRLVVVREGSAINTLPADLSVYPASTVFGNGSQLEPGSYVVYSGNGNAVTVSGLAPGKTYHFSVFEYNGSNGPVYNKTAVLSGFATTSGTLPVSWKDVSATMTGNGVHVKWSTLQEIDAAHFEVERSDDGITYSFRHAVPAAGNSQHLQKYEFNETNLQNGKYHYRIRQVDKNGDHSYSRIVTVHYLADKGKNNASIHPNPAISQVSVVWPGNTSQADLMVIDAAGKNVLARKVSKGELISIQALRPGLYYFRMNTREQVYTVPLIKL